MLKSINEFDMREVPLTLPHSATPNATILLLDYIVTHFLDHSRPAVNLGAYTCRDLDYLLPICRKVSKKIECVESFVPITKADTRLQLQAEIEQAYPSNLIKWTWADASESEYLSSADYVFFSVSTDYPIEQHMYSTNHDCVWACCNTSYLWPRIAKALYYEQLFVLLYSQNLHFFTNSPTIVEQWTAAMPQIKLMLDPWKWFLESVGHGWMLKHPHFKGGMREQWKFINSLG